MPETYAHKKARWQQQAATLPHNLGKRISLRNVSLVAALEIDTQKTLADALDQGVSVRQVRKATRILKRLPALSVSDLLAMLGTDTPATWPTQSLSQTDLDSHLNSTNSDIKTSRLSDPLIQADTLSALTDLLQFCFPDMGRTPAEALAKTPNMELVRGLLSTSQACFDPAASRSDIHIIVLAGLIQKLTGQLDNLITTNPGYPRALQNSGVEWRKR
jgi:hypothetical protein